MCFRMIIYLEDLKLWTRLCSNIPMRTPKRKSLMKTEFIKNRKPNETIKVNINTGTSLFLNGIKKLIMCTFFKRFSKHCLETWPKNL